MWGELGRRVSELGVHPNYLTISGLLLSLLVPVAAYLGHGLLSLLLMMFSALFDALDGLVARASGKESRLGAMLDSMSDRASDSAYVLALAFLGVDWLLCYLLITLSFIISYQAALAQSIGLRMKGVGLLERKYRVPGILLAAALALVEPRAAALVALLLIALSLITIAQRLSLLVRAA
ncbi:MAG: CDP-alcohol phosphatidyltransferase family protein [Acidilobaceae archaeon]|nr:CDP-alcohol phosphatidyltransferase family protein [Acidilobaceae archaeon]